MIFSLNELVHWLGLTIFEMWINLISLTIFTILLALKLDEDYFLGSTGWWIVFSPLFVADGLNTYFYAIIFIRMGMEGIIKIAIPRVVWSLMLLLLIFVFKYFLCKKLSGQSTLEYSEVFSPIILLLQLIAIRACHLH
ncbi:transmembrane protein 203 [Andrena cerasifolii]|uniref:transmembrane protein 203 n=1 Tax=Andrena cerasifolii TaxID=2819439 RepID=UPI004037C90D